MRTLLDPLLRRSTYAGLLYMLIALPLSLAYLAVIAIGMSLGVGTLVLGIGFPILVGMMVVWRAASLLEHKTAVSLLDASIGPPPSPFPQSGGPWSRVKMFAEDSFTWRALAWILLRFPLGVLSFAVVIVLVTIALAGIGSPISVINGGEIHILSGQAITDPLDTWPLVALGLVAAVLLPHVLDRLSWVHRRLIEGLLRPSAE